MLGRQVAVNNILIQQITLESSDFNYRHYQTGVPGTIEVDSWWLDMICKNRSDLPDSE